MISIKDLIYQLCLLQLLINRYRIIFTNFWSTLAKNIQFEPIKCQFFHQIVVRECVGGSSVTGWDCEVSCQSSTVHFHSSLAKAYFLDLVCTKLFIVLRLKHQIRLECFDRSLTSKIMTLKHFQPSLMLYNKCFFR